VKVRDAKNVVSVLDQEKNFVRHVGEKEEYGVVIVLVLEKDF
jgi:hypothetical protein